MKKAPQEYSLHSAFTMIELVFVIVIIGILATVIIPSTRTNPLREAAIQLVSHIRYTQHLAMVDDKFDVSDANWYKNRWQINFVNSSTITNPGVTYTIFSDWKNSSTANPDEEEIAKNPLNSEKVLSGGHSNLNASFDKSLTSKLNLTQSYGVTSYDLDDLDSSLANGCSGARITFDYLGRPIKGKLGTSSGNITAYESDNLLQRPCYVTLSNSSDSVIIKIHPESGYACILKDNNPSSKCL